MLAHHFPMLIQSVSSVSGRSGRTYCRRLYEAQRLGIALVSVQDLNMPFEDLGTPE